MSYHVRSWLSCVMLCCVALCCIMSCHVLLLCYVMSCYLMLCDFLVQIQWQRLYFSLSLVDFVKYVLTFNWEIPAPGPSQRQLGFGFKNRWLNDQKPLLLSRQPEVQSIYIYITVLPFSFNRLYLLLVLQLWLFDQTHSSLELTRN